MEELSQIVGEVLNIHSEPINNENATIELTMKELLEVCKRVANQIF